MKKLSKLIIFNLLMAVLVIVFIPLSTTQAASQPIATDHYLQKIKAKGEIVMGTSPNFPPYEFIVHGNSHVVGLDVAVAQKIAHDMGVKLVIRTMDFNSLLMALQSGKVDMVVAGMSKTAKRAESVDFSNTYFNGGMDLVIRASDRHQIKDYHSLSGKTIGSQTGSIQYNMIRDQAKKSKLTGMDKSTSLILALQTHKLDAVALDQPTAEAYAKKVGGLVAIRSGFNMGETPGMAVAFPKGAQSLVNSTNKSIAEIKAHNLINQKYLPQAKKYFATGNSPQERAAANSMWAYKDFFAIGFKYTLIISVASIILGVILGTILALMRFSYNRMIKLVAVSYIEFVRGTPLMVQVLFIYFGLGLFIDMPTLLSGIIAVSLNAAAYIAEVIRSGINSVPIGQTEAAYSLGMNRHLTMKAIIFPQAMKNIWPALGNQLISLVKDSSIVSVIGVSELIYQSRIIQADTFRGIMPLVIVMLLYFMVTFSISRIMHHFEVKMSH